LLENTMNRSSARRNSLSALAGLMLAGTLVATPASANEVVALKNALYGAGYQVSNVNAEMDAATRSALESYQQAQGLMVTGELDEATRESLGLGGVTLASGASARSSTSSGGSSSATQAEETTVDEPEEAAEEEEDEDDGWSLW
jgi:hypothetical protein